MNTRVMHSETARGVFQANRQVMTNLTLALHMTSGMYASCTLPVACTLQANRQSTAAALTAVIYHTQEHV
jgi:hypothetical protein